MRYISEKKEIGIEERSSKLYKGMNPFTTAIFCPSAPVIKLMNFWAQAVGSPKV
jgi:hypothetical protein